MTADISTETYTLLHIDVSEQRLALQESIINEKSRSGSRNNKKSITSLRKQTFPRLRRVTRNQGGEFGGDSPSNWRVWDRFSADLTWVVGHPLDHSPIASTEPMMSTSPTGASDVTDGNDINIFHCRYSSGDNQ